MLRKYTVLMACTGAAYPHSGVATAAFLRAFPRMQALDEIVESVSGVAHHSVVSGSLWLRATWLPPIVNCTSSYLFNAETDPDEDLNEDEVEVTLKKVMTLYEQAKAGIGGGGKVGSMLC